MTDPDEVPLDGYRNEFRTALNLEIDAARRTAFSSAVPLANGRLIGQVGTQFQYIFTVDTFLNVPGDSPGDLHVPGKSPLEVAVVSVEGMTVTLSLPISIGTFVPTARLQSNLTQLMRKLVSRIEDMGSNPNEVGDRVLGFSTAKGRPSRIEPRELNENQQLAVESGLGRNLTFVWGPPGTGKTATIGRLAAELHDANRPLLLVSHTNTAVDQALLKLLPLVDQHRITEGSIIRVGEPRDKRLLEHPDCLLHTQVERRSAELISQLGLLSDERVAVTSEVKTLQARLDLLEWTVAASEDIAQATRDFARLQEGDDTLQQLEADHSHLVEMAEHWKAVVRAATESQEKQRRLAALRNDTDRSGVSIDRKRRRIDEIASELDAARALLNRSEGAGGLTRRWRRLPQPDEVRAVIGDLQASLANLGQELDTTTAQLDSLRHEQAALEKSIRAFSDRFGSVDQVLLEHDRHSKKEDESAQETWAFRKELDQERRLLEDRLTTWVNLLVHWELLDSRDRSLEGQLNALSEAHDEALTKLEGFDAGDARSRVTSGNKRLAALAEEIESLEKKLQRVAEVVVSEATVIATTLTRAYLRDSIQSRRFDTVILDEASMAPIPALWIAASVADKNAVVVGDFKQLPPIVLSTQRIAEKWLGRDIFDVAGVVDRDTPPSHFIALRRQYRMHPSISGIVNSLIYEGALVDDHVTRDDRALYEWYGPGERLDEPVLLVDTKPLHAWVTSVHRGGSSSRLNFLSALVSVDLAAQMLNTRRPPAVPGDRPRVLLVSPYRPHARLQELLVRDQGLDSDVVAGTAHNFQGSEADVVILDLVNDEPHWKVGMFIPKYDHSQRRLLNVAVTRARRRLVVVGDFDWMAKNARKAFLGRELIRYLTDNFPTVDAREVVVSDIFAGAADANAALHGGAVVAGSDRVVVTQDAFYELFRADLAAASKRVVIYSPFMTESRVANLAPHLRAAITRGVQVHVVTKAHDDRGRRELGQYQALERALKDWGVIVIHKGRMHEKVVFIDDHLLWSGSLNPLSFSNTQEVMERRNSESVAVDFANTLRLNDLIAEYTDGAPVCPICGAEMIAQEGKDDPYYWRCVEPSCYTRSIDTPVLAGGRITCTNCGGEVEYGHWGDRPAWRCRANRRHRQWVARTHLRLPQMRDLVPGAELARLDREYGLEQNAS